jgi:hypothetical protein
VPKNTRVTIYGGDGNWIQMETPVRLRGWGHRGFVTAEDDGRY